MHALTLALCAIPTELQMWRHGVSKTTARAFDVAASPLACGWFPLGMQGFIRGENPAAPCNPASLEYVVGVG